MEGVMYERDGQTISCCLEGAVPGNLCKPQT